MNCVPRLAVSRYRSALTLAAAAFAAAQGGAALGYLGSFSPADGYSINVFSGNYNWADVTYYNAGAYGPNAGGGSGPTFIPADTGKWSLLSNAGGFFSTSAARSATVGSAPPYPTTHPTGVPVYLIGDHFGGRTDNSALAFRNDMPQGSVGRAEYDYVIDSFDTGGVNPTSITSGIVSHDIYFFSNPADPVVPGVRAPNKFGLGFRDSAGNVGVEWGYARDNELQWRAGAGPWIPTGLYANAAYDGMRVNIDLTTQTFGIDYFNAITTTWSPLVPVGTPLGAAMNNLAGLRWGLEDGVNSGIGGKNLFDDSSFVIPTPGAAALLALGALGAARRRRA
jgi:hypothetical protein